MKLYTFLSFQRFQMAQDLSLWHVKCETLFWLPLQYLLLQKKKNEIDSGAQKVFQVISICFFFVK